MPKREPATARHPIHGRLGFGPLSRRDQLAHPQPIDFATGVKSRWTSDRRVRLSRTVYAGRSMIRRCIRARYSPIIPRAKSWAPENIAIAEARNGKPGIAPPQIT